MFKFRRRSPFCSSKEGVTDEGVHPEDNNKDKDSQRVVKTESHDLSASSSDNRDSNDSKETKWPFISGASFFRKSFRGPVKEARKRKEDERNDENMRNKGDSVEGNSKVVRSRSDDEYASSLAYAVGVANNLRRTLSHDDFDKRKGNSRKPKQEHFQTMALKNPVVGEIPIPLARVHPPQECLNEKRQTERLADYYNPTGSSSRSVPIKKRVHRRHKKTKNYEEEDDDGSSWTVEENNATESSSSLTTVEEPPPLNLEPGEDEAFSSNASSSSSDKEDEICQNGQDKKSFLDALVRGPVPEGHVMLSPRSITFLRGRGESIVEDLPPSPPNQQLEVEAPARRHQQYENEATAKIQSLTRLLGILKKTLREMEEDYEMVFGYRPSHADKLNNKDMKKCLMQMAKAKKELKALKDDPTTHILSKLSANTHHLLSVQNRNAFAHLQRGSSEYFKELEATVKEISDTLENHRHRENRPNSPERMSLEQVTDEKSLMQRQLLVLEKKHGRPTSKQEKDIVRVLYDRYRLLKKTGFGLVSKGGGLLKGDNMKKVVDLVPIIEHVTLEFPTHKQQVEEGVVVEGPSSSSRIRDIDTDMEEEAENNEEMSTESFNSMTLKELEQRRQEAKEEKRRLRAILRRFESEFQDATGRPPLKEDKYSPATEMEAPYQKYKRTRATIRLLDVLITKKKKDSSLVLGGEQGLSKEHYDMNKF